MRVVAYIRVSTVDQAHEGVSLDAQRARIAGWAEASGLVLRDDDAHVDAGISGKRADNRPGLASALASACEARGVLVVYSLSRLARSVRDTLAIAERLEDAGADLVSLSERIDTTSASGKMVFRMLAVLAEFERDLVSERTRTALAHKRSRSERLGQVPYGSRLGTDGRTLATDPHEDRVLQYIRGRAGAGWSPRAIARDLTARGHPTKNGRGAWSHTTVARILRRTAPTGPDAPPEPDRGEIHDDQGEARPPGPHPGLDPEQAHPGLSVA